MEFIEFGDSRRPPVLIIEDREALAAEKAVLLPLADDYHVILSVDGAEKQNVEQEADETECYLQGQGGRLHAICATPRGWLLLQTLLKRNHLDSDLVIAQMVQNPLSSLILPMLQTSAAEK